MTKTDPTVTLIQAKKILRAAFDQGEGIDCPCCGQLVKKYKRALNSSMALGLIVLARWDTRAPGEFVHLEDHLAKHCNLPPAVRGDVAKLRYWGLIEMKRGKRDDHSPRIGLYRITDAGRDFVYGDTSVASHVYLYDQKVLGFESSQVGIREALGTKFDYGELMSHGWG